MVVQTHPRWCPALAARQRGQHGGQNCSLAKGRQRLAIFRVVVAAVRAYKRTSAGRRVAKRSASDGRRPSGAPAPQDGRWARMAMFLLGGVETSWAGIGSRFWGGGVPARRVF